MQEHAKADPHQTKPSNCPFLHTKLVWRQAHKAPTLARSRPMAQLHTKLNTCHNHSEWQHPSKPETVCQRSASAWFQHEISTQQYTRLKQREAVRRDRSKPKSGSPAGDRRALQALGMRSDDGLCGTLAGGFSTRQRQSARKRAPLLDVCNDTIPYKQVTEGWQQLLP